MKTRSPFGVALRATYLCLITLILSVTLVQQRQSLTAEKEYRKSVAGIPVLAPDTIPEVSQKSIDLALVMYGIDIPATAGWPELDKKLSDRGLTTRGAMMEKAQVTIGPAAFASWALLGSTLSHELEVHCEQNFLFIFLMDMVGLDGTGEAERQAYRHELANAKRFGLPGGEKLLIEETMDYYYPDFRQANKGWSIAVRSWMARNLLNPKASI